MTDRIESMQIGVDELRAANERIRELEADCIRLKSAWDSAYRQAMENGQAFGAEREVSDKLEAALETVLSDMQSGRFDEDAARAALSEVAAIRAKGDNAIELTGSPLAASPATGGSDVE